MPPAESASASTRSAEDAAARRRRWVVAGALLLISTLSLLPRLPFLLAADGELNSDEAVNALALRHAVEAGKLRFHSWDATYYGLFETYLGLPFVALFGWRAVAVKLAAVVGYLLLLLFVFLLGRRLAAGGEGDAVGVAAVGMLSVVSPQVVQWSTLASGGYLLVVAWGTLGLLAYDRLRAAGAPLRRFLLFGLIAGFGLYVYELFLVYLALFALAGLAAAPAWRRLPRRRLFAAAGALVTGFVLGWSPKLAVLLAGAGAAGAKAPSYRLADGARRMENLELMLSGCIPALLGVDPAGTGTLAVVNGPRVAAGGPLGALLLVLFAAAWSAAAWRCRARFAAVLRGRGEPLGVEALLVVLVPLTAAAFVFSTNPTDLLSNRYLLPWLTALPLLAGHAAVRWSRRWPWPVLAGLALLVALPAAQTASFLRARGLVDAELRPVRVEDDALRLADHLVSEGIEGGYAPYWLSYRLTFLTGERTILATFQGWQRHPPYVERVAALGDPVFVLPAGDRVEGIFLDRLASAGRGYVRREVGSLHVYRSREGRPLLPPSTVPVEVLREPRARIEVPEAPSRVAGGTTLELPVRVENLGDQPWSASGVGESGKHRVSLSYRWLSRDGRVASSSQRRSLLPADVRPGEALDMIARVDVPGRPAERVLVLTLVQDGAAWFADRSGGAARLPMEILAARQGEAASSGSPAPSAVRSPPG